MRKRAWAGVVGLGALIAATSGCAGVQTIPATKTPPAAAARAPRPVCAESASPGRPALCIPEDGSGTFVVGLPSGHGWQRGSWVLLEVERPGLSEGWAAAIAVVVEAYTDVARVGVLYQREARLDGARARMLGKEERARLSKFVGRVLRVEGGRVQLDVGSHDGAAVGDVYELRAAQDAQASVGRVQVTEVGDLYAWAAVLEAEGPAREGQAATFLRRADEGSERRKVSILVVNFDPEDEQDAEEAKAGRGVAKQLANALGNAAQGMKGVSVRYEGNERVRVAGPDVEGHRAARGIGKQFGADIVVWGAMRCDKHACAQPRFTVVEPVWLQQHGYAGAEIWARRDEAGLRLTDGSFAEPIALAAAILGSVAFAAQQYGDASYYLGQALSKGVLRGEDELYALKRLASAMYVRGQSAAARAQATALVERARKAKATRWEHLGRGELARIDMLEGKVPEARGHLEAIRRWSEAQNDEASLAYALHMLAMLERQQGRVEEARKLFQRSLELDRSIQDLQGEAVTLYEVANLSLRQARVEEALELFQQSLALSRRIGNVEGEAASLYAVASLELQKGRAEEARELFQQSLVLSMGIGDVLSETATLHQLAILESEQGRVEEARRLFQQSLELSRRAGDAQGEAATLHEIGRLEAERGSMEEARKLFQQSLEKDRRIGNVTGELATCIDLAALDFLEGKRLDSRQALVRALARARALGHAEYQARALDWLGFMDRAEGQLAAARERWTEAVAIYRRLQLPAKIDVLMQQLALIPLVEKAIEVRRTHTALLTGGGVLVTRILPDSQAGSAGLTAGDILIRYGTDRLDKAATLQELVKGTDPRRAVTLELLRGDKELTIKLRGGPLGVVIEDLPPLPTPASAPPASPRRPADGP